MNVSSDPMRYLAEALDPQPGSAVGGPADSSRDDDVDGADPFADVPLDPSDIDLAVVQACADLDHSDTANGDRLRRHFGRDLVVLQTEGARSADWLAWTDTHWDAAAGYDLALVTAQKIGDLIKLEADYLTQKRGEPAAAFEMRKGRRRSFGVTAKNRGRLDAMLGCAAPHLCRQPDAFNADPRLVATIDHTLRFATAPGECEGSTLAFCDATCGHSREDWITKVVPVAYDPEATAPRWLAFLERFLPVEDVRACVQTFAGAGLLGVPIQRVMFHYGNGANGKSVFMETLSRILGPLAVDLPAESVSGAGERSGAGASPDLARLYCARMVRVSELPPNTPLREDLVKKLTGGERIPVRNLFKGFFDFKPIFKAHMSGNDFPRIDGTDNGIWRRMTVVHWPITIPKAEQRDFEEVVREFVAEAPGILNWLITGALTYLERGLVIPVEVETATQSYRDEMDPIGQFVSDCVVEAPGEKIGASEFYAAYQSWSDANAKRPKNQNAFGRAMTKRFRRVEGRLHYYEGCVLSNVPSRPAPPLDEDYHRDYR